jgi:hypothetical protein
MPAPFGFVGMDSENVTVGSYGPTELWRIATLTRAAWHLLIHSY